jgi:excisionase family DNA binding protein
MTLALADEWEQVASTATTHSDGSTMTRKRELPVFIRLNEAAYMMSMSTGTIRRRISDGTIPAYQCGRPTIRLKLDEVESALRRIPSTRRLR